MVELRLYTAVTAVRFCHEVPTIKEYMFKIYFTNEHGEARSYNEESLTAALATAEGLRRNTRYSFITMVSENPDCTSKTGVDSVTDTANYDGWISRGRAP